MKITAIIENSKIESNSPLLTEAGLALYIETTKNKILFDTGISSKMIHNAKQLGIPLDQVDICIISHGHFDHTGGLMAFLRLNQKANVYIKKGADKQFFFKIGFLKKNVSAPSEIFTTYKDRIIWIDKLSQVIEDVFLITDIAQPHPLYGGFRRLLVKEEHQFKQDTFAHELIALIKDSSGKSIAITGCSHNGILNMIDTIKSVFPKESITAIFGGFHFVGIPVIKNSMAATSSEVIEIGRQLLTCNIPKIYTMHCTGIKAFNILKGIMGDTLSYFSTGESIDI